MEQQPPDAPKPLQKLAMGHHLLVVKPSQAGRAMCKTGDRLKVLTGIEEHGCGTRVAYVKNTRTRTSMRMAVNCLRHFCKVIGYDGPEDFE